MRNTELRTSALINWARPGSVTDMAAHRQTQPLSNTGTVLLEHLHLILGEQIVLMLQVGAKLITTLHSMKDIMQFAQKVQNLTTFSADF